MGHLCKLEQHFINTCFPQLFWDSNRASLLDPPSYGFILNSWKTLDRDSIMRLPRDTLSRVHGEGIVEKAAHHLPTVCPVKSSGRKFFLLLAPRSVTLTGRWAAFTLGWRVPHCINSLPSCLFLVAGILKQKLRTTCVGGKDSPPYAV